MVRKSVTCRGLEKLCKGALVGIIGFVSPYSYGGVVVKSHPVEQKWEANGTTEYRMDVLANTTAPDVADKHFRSASWWVVIPDSLTFVRGELPDPINNPSQNLDDFFYNFFMEPGFNYVDNTVSDGGPAGWTQLLTGNSRNTNNPSEGPMNVNDKILGSYFFTTNVNAPIGQQGNFLVSAVSIYDTAAVAYRVSNGNLTIENQLFRIMPRRGDVNGDGIKDASDVNTFVNVLLGSEQNANYMEYADWSGNNDGVPDGRDIQGFVQNYLAP